MKIDSIKIKDQDTRFTLKPTRTGEIKFREGTIETPNRAATLYEYNAKARVPTNILLDNPITMKYNSVSYNSMKRLLTENETFASWYSAQENANYRSQHSLLRFSVFQPTVSYNKKRGTPPAMKILESPNELDKFLDLIIAFQENLQFDIITIPYLNLPISVLIETYKKRTKYIRSIGKEPFFIISLKHNPPDFEQLIELFVNDFQSQLIGLVFRRFQYAALNYLALSKYYSKDVLFYCLQTERSDPQFNDISSSLVSIFEISVFVL